jgi:hypothetical protein
MKQYSENIGDTADEASGAIGDIHSDIEDKQADFDNVAENSATVEGVNEYAASIDENLKTQSTVEAASMGINGASAAVAGARLLSQGAFTFGATTIIGALGVAVGVKSTYGMGVTKGAMEEQLEYRSDAKDEISVREDTENMVSDLNDHLDDELDNYAGSLDAISENTTIDIPDDVSVGGEDTLAEDPGPSITMIAAENDKNKNNKNKNKNGNQNQSQNTIQPYALNLSANKTNNTNKTNGTTGNDSKNPFDNKKDDEPKTV